MKTVWLCVVLGGLVAWTTKPAWSNPAPAPAESLAIAEALSAAFEQAADRVRPAVVSIYSERTLRFRQWDWPFPFGDDFLERFFGQGRPAPSPRPQPRERRIPQRGTGSGIIVDKEGFILTNYHVVRDVEKINVQLADRRRFEAELVGFDEKTDVAIIRIKGRVPADLPVATLGDSDKLRVGEWVLAVGAPFGLAQTVTAGIISATGRANVGVADYEDFIQTDAAINPGNSGGPLVNLRGEVVGINTAIATAVGQFAGVGFAIPINMAKNMMPTLRKGETVVRGFLGVIIQDVTDELAEQFKLPEPRGALVTQVNKDSPAEKAGLKPGDIILRYRERAVQDTRELRNAVAATAPGTRADLVIWRDGKERTITVTVGRLTPETAAAGSTEQPDSVSRWGLAVQPLTPELAEEFGYRDLTGVLVTDVQPDSPAADAELQRGDLILEVNRQPVGSVAELQEALAKAGERALLLIRRRDASLFVVLKSK